MVEDKLEHDERLRLECLAQSIAFAASNRVVGESPEQTVQRALKFEQFVKNGA